MSDFDPYHQWLGIPPQEQPAHYYRLLGIAPDETDKETIREAALQRNAFIRQFSLGEQGKIAERLLNEIAAARDNILAGKVQTAVETPSPTETPIEPVVEKTDPAAATPVSPIPVVVREPVIQEIPAAIVQPAKRPRRRKPKEIWKRPAVIGVSVVSVIGVLALFISLMFSGDADPVSNTAGRISTETPQPEPQPEPQPQPQPVPVLADPILADPILADPILADPILADPILADPPVTDLPSITNTIGMKLNLIPSGSFLMGSPEDEEGRRDDEYPHPVTITKAFYMQTTEVTQGQWKEVMGTEPWKSNSLVKEGPNYPASYVSWDDAAAYCEKLSEKEGKTYRLPTEAEWEYACRAGTMTAWSFGNNEKDFDDYAWHDENTNEINERYAHQVGQKRPNAFGLYDMHGNVYEWCHDYFEEDYYKQSPAKDPTGPTSPSYRVFRGGSWDSSTRDSRSAVRFWFVVGTRSFDDGFRLVRELDDSTQSTPPPVPPTTPAIDSITNKIGMKLNEIPAGTFTMGSPEGETGRGDDETQHEVTITKAFYMQTTEVTQGQWKEVMGTEPWKGKQYVKEGPDYPATYVSWNDAVAFCNQLQLREKESKTYRLPTEAEWEYACRAGTKTTWSFDDDQASLGDYAWYDGNAWRIGEKCAHQVGQKKPNAFGLYDMHGNVWEWCHDYYEKDPTGPARGSSRVLRGGSWDDLSRLTRSANRSRFDAGRRFNYVGFRLVRELDDSTQITPPPVPPTAPEIESTTNTIGMKLNLIPSGSFTMGSPEGEEGRRDNETQHPVTISKPFYMQTTEVTQVQWKEVMGTEPWKGNPYVKEGPNNAAMYVTWNDAVAYCKKLSEKEGKTYRLPTEAEWEYACRAGTETAWSFGDDEKALGDYAWYRENAWDIDEKYAHQVELKKPNAFGLYDMYGNVFEWCHDYFHEDYYKQSPAKEPMQGSFRVLRGGSWVFNTRVARSAYRYGGDADFRYYGSGFRLVRELD